jgi:hypothetical protein
MAAVCPLTGDRVIGFIRLTISAIHFSSSFPFPFDFCCFRAVTARPITTFFKSALQFFILVFIFHATPIKATNLLTLTRPETFSTTEWSTVLADGFRPV